ncbi:hypothetical protein MMC15_002864 [Xylographa vitiligo]|nr:hypothetical protein [Xylographa vitiligo]
MEHERICPRCKELCQKIACYLEGGDILFSSQALGTVAEIRLRTHCSVCEFLLKAFDRSCPAGLKVDHETALEIQTNNHGTLYIQGNPQGDRQRVYLLPLDSSQVSISGRLIKPRCDPDLLKQWLRSCRDWHGSDCYTPGWSELITPLAKIKVRLIDVHQRCLVPVPPVCQFIALSYVWGKAKIFQTTRSNVAVRCEINGLNEVLRDLPATITDAIDLVAMIGERYLWVDSLCIVQDNAQEKHGQIANMDAIYGNAVLTINAAAGQDANAGLPGVRLFSRKVEQLVLEYQPGHRLIAGQPIMTGVADSSCWNTRAWTYQERFLSKRSLTFTDSHVFFQCQRMVWCEDVAAEDNKIIDYHQMEDYLPIDWSSERNDHMYKLHYALHVYKSTNWVEYLRTVEEYTPRMLSFDSDILAAFAGMSKVLSSMFRSRLLYGLPESLFDCALLWQPAGTIVRRHVPRPTSNSSGRYFPSWSWAGWKGSIVYEDIMPHLKMLSDELVRRTKPLVKWQKQTADGSFTTSISSMEEVGQYLLKPFEERLPEGWHVSEGGAFDNFIGTYYYHDDSPLSFFAIPTPLTTTLEDPDDLCWTRLVGTTSSSLLKIVPEQDSATEETQRFSVTDESGLWCGCVYLDCSWTRRTTEMHEFIVLSEGTTPKAEIERFWSTEEWSHIKGDDSTTWYQYFNVLLIEREGPLASRAGIGKIDKHRWSSLPTTMNEVCLA